MKKQINTALIIKEEIIASAATFLGKWKIENYL